MLKVSAQNCSSGFTLVEVLVVVALLGVFAVVATDTFTNILRAQNKARVVSELEQAGNYALSIMEQQIRDAEEVLCCGGTCPSGMNNSGVGIRLDGEEVCFCPWTLWSAEEGTWKTICRHVGGDCSQDGGTSCGGGTMGTDYTYLTDTDPVTGVDVTETEFACDAEGKRVRIKLVLRPAPGSPSRQDFRTSPITLETTVVVRGSYR